MMTFEGDRPEKSPGWPAEVSLEQGVAKNKYVAFCSQDQLALVMFILQTFTPDVSVSKLEQKPATKGMGRLKTLESPLTVQAVVGMTKEHCGVPSLRVALARGKHLGEWSPVRQRSGVLPLRKTLYSGTRHVCGYVCIDRGAE